MNTRAKLSWIGLAVLIAVVGVAAKNDGVSSLPVYGGPFPDTENMVFLGQVSPEDMGALPLPGVWAKGMLNDIWGWTSPSGEEYALVGHTNGAGFVRVTDPENPTFLGMIPSESAANFGNIWGDIATFGNYAYFVTEISPSTVRIVDLSILDALGPAPSPTTPLPVAAMFSGGGYESAHNIYINESSGFAYLAGVRLTPGSNACGNADPPRFNTLILDLNATPTNPGVVACIDGIGEHDFYVVNYTGPDADHQGSEIAFVFDGRDRTGDLIGGFTHIWDVTDKNNIVQLASFRVPGLVFSNNGWTTEEQDYLFIGDELEELILAGWAIAPFFAQPVDVPTKKARTGTFILDISDLDNPVFIERYRHSIVGLDHNFMVEGDKIYLAAYTSGTRVLQINRDGGGAVSLEEIAHMDTEPRLPKNILNIQQEERFSSSFLGQWGIYAQFDSGTIIASDMNNGLIVMRLTGPPGAVQVEAVAQD